MKKIVVLSDSHGRVETVKRILQSVGKYDAFIFCGDGFSDFAYINFPTHVHRISVTGNVDRGVVYGESELVVEEVFGVQCAVTHGHNYNAKVSLVGLHSLAQSQGVRLLCYGHTHIANVFEGDTYTLVNPGAAALGEYAVISVEGSVVQVEHKSIRV